jgi:hypothetical protein
MEKLMTPNLGDGVMWLTEKKNQKKIHTFAKEKRWVNFTCAALQAITEKSDGNVPRNIFEVITEKLNL